MTLELKDLLIIIASALLSCMITVIVMKKFFPVPQIARVDLQALILKASNRLSLKDIPDVELKNQINTFITQLKAEIHALAKQKNLIILNSQQVIEGATDLTELIETKLEDFK